MKYQINYKCQYPIRLLYGVLKSDTEEYAIPIAFPAKTDWGELIPNSDYEVLGSKIELELGWLAIETSKIYYFKGQIPIPKEIITSNLFTLLIGLGNKGELALWLYNKQKCILYLYTHGINISDKVTDDIIFEASFTDINGNRIHSKKKLCQDDMMKFRQYLKNKKEIKDCIENRMKQYTYRYDVKLKKSSEEIFIKELLFDGSFDKTKNQNLFSYHDAGKVRKLSINWIDRDIEGKDEISAFFLFNEDEITQIFERFYGAHPETKVDFIIRIDTENKKYELALYRQGLKEPVVIPESAYQLIVFKNKFEDYRSENYNQPRGAWIW